ncbi:hypothetical protein [Chitinophaga rhizophila]|uniref:Uncharacterized protein n=1 Tax=Chitinophaga rhizophila TaxID=2866212 RepID=A0ABS7G6G3_9BACT|nr:hypothetical protein [Chitinophaga rhizophila]MBW8683046.1 hypothetical protein [Chitinophaga rhizophila]
MEREEENKRYRFRLMYFHCTNNQVISPNTHMTNAYQFKETAEKAINNRSFPYMWENREQRPPQSRIEGFYLVHESLYDLILKPFVKEE